MTDEIGARAMEFDLIGFGTAASPVRILRAKVGEKPVPPKAEPPDGFFDPPDDDDNGNANGAGAPPV